MVGLILLGGATGSSLVFSEGRKPAVSVLLFYTNTVTFHCFICDEEGILRCRYNLVLSIAKEREGEINKPFNYSWENKQ